MKILKTESFDIAYKEGDTAVRDVLETVRSAVKINKGLFGEMPKKFLVVLAYSKDEFDKYAGVSGLDSYTECYAVHNKIILVSPSVKKTVKGLHQAMTHEMNHLFYHNIARTAKTAWMPTEVELEERPSSKKMAGSLPPPEKKWKRFFGFGHGAK